jgi:hypothetical protein
MPRLQPARPRSAALRRGAVWAGALALAAAGLAPAQPVIPPPAPLEVPPVDPAPEEAPPAEVAPPAPVAAPPVKPSEVTEAPPPKEQAVEKPIETKTKRPRYDVAILQALDKVTAETVRFEAAVGQPIRYKNLVITVRACEQAATDEPVEDSMAYLTVQSQPRAADGKSSPAARQVFRGWMYASSPALNPLEHPVYDAWLISCKTPAPVSAAPAAAKSPVT